jgi:hypothetical protein
MNGLSKEEQLKRSKPKNPKKLGYIAWHDYVDYLNDFSNGKCQVCKTNPLHDFHHAIFGSYGADKDDHSLVGVCRKCHEDCHKDKHGAVNSKAVRIGRSNWKKYKG